MISAAGTPAEKVDQETKKEEEEVFRPKNYGEFLGRFETWPSCKICQFTVKKKTVKNERARINAMLQHLYTDHFSELAKAELTARGHSCGKCPSCPLVLDTFPNMVMHYSILHKKILVHYYHWYLKPESRVLMTGVTPKIPKVLKTTTNTGAGVIKMRKEKGKLRVKYFGDHGSPRMIDTEAVRKREAERDVVST